MLSLDDDTALLSCGAHVKGKPLGQRITKEDNAVLFLLRQSTASLNQKDEGGPVASCRIRLQPKIVCQFSRCMWRCGYTATSTLDVSCDCTAAR